MKKEQNELTFEQAVGRLEEIVRKLEGGTAALEESLGLFEEGVALVKLCTGKLDSAEQQVKKLVADPSGKLTETDMDDAT